MSEPTIRCRHCGATTPLALTSDGWLCDDCQFELGGEELIEIVNRTRELVSALCPVCGADDPEIPAHQFRGEPIRYGTYQYPAVTTIQCRKCGETSPVAAWQRAKEQVEFARLGVSTPRGGEVNKIEITVPFVPAAVLLPNNRRRAHWSKQAEATADLRMATRGAAMIWRALSGCIDSPVFVSPVVISYLVAWPRDRYRGRRPMPDADALPTALKATLDSIVEAGIIKDDSPEYVTEVRATQCRDSDGFGYVSIVVREVVG